MTKQHRDFRNEVLRFVSSFVQANGYAPTYDEIAASVGLSSKSHVDYYLSALEAAGAIQRKPWTPRALRLVGPAANTFEVRVEGNIAAGQPLGLPQGPLGTLQVTSDIADPRSDLFALRVQGDSMVDALVGDGDIVIVERDHEVRRGQLAVVYLTDRNEATLKHVYPEGSQVRLQPAHPTLPPFYVQAESVQIQGRVVAVIRRT